MKRAWWKRLLMAKVPRVYGARGIRRRHYAGSNTTKRLLRRQQRRALEREQARERREG